MDQSGGLSRGNTTWLLYAVLSCLSFLLNGLGAVLVPLQEDLHADRAAVAFYPTLFAVGLLLVGAVGGPLVDRIGRGTTMRVAIIFMVVGGVLLAAPVRAVTLVGAMLLGAGGALLIQVIPALLASLHPHAPSAAVGEANGLASGASVLAPLAVAGALATGLGWRVGYLVVPLVFLVVIVVTTWRIPLPEPSEHDPDRPVDPGKGLLGPWVEVLFAVSVEFCMVFWAASAVIDWHDTSSGAAPAVASLFLVGMATGRTLAVPITRRMPNDRALMLVCIGVATVGFAVFWAAPVLVVSAIGLAVTGGGVALLYPTAVSRTIAAWPHAPNRAAARAALASGLAIGGAPFLLARLSDQIGLRTAYLIVPLLLLALATRTVAARR